MIKIKQSLSFLFLAMTILSITVSLTIIISPAVYHIIIDVFDLGRISGLTHQQLMDNYVSIIRFLFNPFETTLQMLYFSSSKQGLIHFHEVSQWVIINAALSLVSIIVIYSITQRINKLPMYKKRALHVHFQILIALPIGLLFLIVVGFDYLFYWFHRLLFNNSYWIFDPLVDPVIQVLPQGLFMILFILAVLIYEGLVLGIRWISLSKKR